ncbi:4Fe-4S dicluster domain-containing protein [Methanorbis rubei]|uniref:Ferredoxin n=1 Tax=Methanorbis rubei TaxID=3028300 RepID=A0AAE4SBN5_9EURY|nr:Ion-translocating oxidoreductase complex subunit B [Methanocorpusculaceae archaeon Cs1]
MCSFGHNGVFNPRLSSVSVIDYPESAVTIPLMCLQCEDAVCQNVCPVGAIYRDKNDAVVIDPAKCIVCKLCVNACPLGNMKFSPITRSVFKCDLCGGTPQCARYCHAGAIVYVDPHEDSDRKKRIADQFKEAFSEVKS